MAKRRKIKALGRSPVPPSGYIMDRGRRRPEPPNDWRDEATEGEGPMEEQKSAGVPEVRRIRIHAGPVTMEADLNDSHTAGLIWGALPVESSCMIWGDEVYFNIPVSAETEDARAAVPSGTIAYWPPGPAFCIFFGQTPASPVNVIGTLNGDPDEFAKVKQNETVRLEKA